MTCVLVVLLQMFALRIATDTGLAVNASCSMSGKPDPEGNAQGLCPRNLPF